ncbi:MAG: polysaccharide biosynthesis protein [Hyphomicrobiales bacterium]
MRSWNLDVTRLPRSGKSAMVLATDLVLLPISLWAAFGFRLGVFDVSGLFGDGGALSRLSLFDVLVVLFASGLLLVFFKLYRIKLHAIDLDAIFRIAVYSLCIMAIASVGAFFLQSGFPRSVPIYFGAIFFILAIVVRLVALRVLQALASIGNTRKPIAIYGAGAAGIQLAASLKQSKEVVPTMFLDDNPALHGMIISGCRVKPFSVLERAVRDGRVQQVLIAIPSLSVSRRAAIVEKLTQFGCEVLTVPSYVDLVSGKSTVTDLRSVTIDELLSRDHVDLNLPEIARAYAGRSVMVTGSGGSIGAELCKQLISCNPSRIVLFERSEPALYEIERQLREVWEARTVVIDVCLGSVTDPAAVKEAIRRYGVDVILHAAAHKHVPIIEKSEVEGARNNIIGTKTVVDVALDANIERFILVSTDKAVRPSNVMGATKRMAELVVQDGQQRSQGTKFSMVRFGNVLGSSGSVVPLFTKQIAAGGPVTVTHEDVTRFFMTIPEASRLVLLAGAFSQGGDLFVLDMGQPVKIIDLAKRMIELSGRTVQSADNSDGDIAIDVVGLRPGEKLYEELLLDDDSLVQTPHEKILRASANFPANKAVADMVERVRAAIDDRDGAAIRTIAADYVDGFQDSSKLIPFPGSEEANAIKDRAAKAHEASKTS